MARALHLERAMQRLFIATLGLASCAPTPSDETATSAIGETVSVPIGTRNVLRHEDVQEADVGYLRTVLCKGLPQLVVLDYAACTDTMTVSGVSLTQLEPYGADQSGATFTTDAALLCADPDTDRLWEVTLHAHEGPDRQHIWDVTLGRTLSRSKAEASDTSIEELRAAIESATLEAWGQRRVTPRRRDELPQDLATLLFTDAQETRMRYRPTKTDETTYQEVPIGTATVADTLYEIGGQDGTVAGYVVGIQTSVYHAEGSGENDTRGALLFYDAFGLYRGHAPWWTRLRI